MSYRLFQTANSNRDNSLARWRTQQIRFRSSCCLGAQEPLGGTGFYQAAFTIKTARQPTSPVSPALIRTLGQVWTSLPKVLTGLSLRRARVKLAENGMSEQDFCPRHDTVTECPKEMSSFCDSLSNKTHHLVLLQH